MVVAMKAFNDSITIQMFPEVADALEDQIGGPRKRENQEWQNARRRCEQ